MERNRKTKRMRAEAEAGEKAAKARQAQAQPQPAESVPTQPVPKPPRKRGRPQNSPLWLPDVADFYAQGFTLPIALRKAGIDDLSVAERRKIYRWERFRKLVECACSKYGIREFPHSRRGNHGRFNATA
jgi:hypothetical protein